MMFTPQLLMHQNYIIFQTPSSLGSLWSPAGPRFSPAHSVDALLCRISNWVLFMAAVITGDSMIGAVASQSLTGGKRVSLSAVCFTSTHHFFIAKKTMVSFVCKYSNNVRATLMQYQSCGNSLYSRLLIHATTIRNASL